MTYFDDPKNVETYLEMAEGYDGRALIEILQGYLPAGASVLELGMGPGKDLDILREHYQVTGSDASRLFVERYQAQTPSADVQVLDAVTLDIDSQFDAIYSNKVLHHLSRAELTASFKRQAEILNPGGLLFHSLWYGDGEETFSGMRFTYYTEATLAKHIDPEYELLAQERYTEMDEQDSFYVVLRKKT